MSELRIVNIEKQYGSLQQAGSSTFSLKPVDLAIQEGEFFSLLGPSGCGKTTLLKLVAGLLEPDKGELWVGDADLTKVPPEARKFAMVFQQPLLFPHMTVEDNVAFGLKMQKSGKKERLERARNMLSHVGLKGYSSRFPNELSGGQQQRVALARALVADPRLLLMDEPFSALDPSLREEMRELLGRIQKELRVTVVFVTHDREESFHLSDRIGIMSEGELLQVGTAKELYEQPASTKVASFLGMKNIIPGTIAGGRFAATSAGFDFPAAEAGLNGPAFLILRAETIQLMHGNVDDSRKDRWNFEGIVQSLRFNHGFYTCKVEVGGLELECSLSGQQAQRISRGQTVQLAVDLKDMHWVIQ